MTNTSVLSKAIERRERHRWVAWFSDVLRIFSAQEKVELCARAGMKNRDAIVGTLSGLRDGAVAKVQPEWRVQALALAQLLERGSVRHTPPAAFDDLRRLLGLEESVGLACV